MRNKFSEYYPMNKEEYQQLWDSAIFVIDTNVLLNLYRFSNDVSLELLKIFKSLANRLWIPYQVAWEYHNRRRKVIIKLENSYNNIIKIIDNNLEDIDNKLKVFKKHPFLDIDYIINKIKKYMEGIKKDLRKKKERFPNWFSKDEIMNKVTEIFDNKIGKEISKDELTKIYKEGKKRYNNSIPPGYKDGRVDTSEVTEYSNNNKKLATYGDLIIWFEIIKKAKKEKKPIIFITEDKKEDWWLIIDGRTVGPRYELIREIKDKAGVKFYMYDIYNFQKYAKEYLKAQIKEKTFKELKEFKNLEMIKPPEVDFDSLIKSLERIKPPKVDYDSLIKSLEMIKPPKVDYDSLIKSLEMIKPPKVDYDSFLKKLGEIKKLGEKYNNSDGIIKDDEKPEDTNESNE